MSSRVWQITGLALVGGVGYYLYQAGGDPKAAQKKAEADATKLSNQVKSELPGSAKEAKKDAESTIADASAKADAFAKDARAQADSAAKKAEKDLRGAADKFDQKVTEGTAQVKSGVSSWFGGEKK